MKILISGSRGFVGSALVLYLISKQHAVSRLVGSTAGDQEVQWNPAAGSIDPSKLEEFDALIHLAGENIATGRWTKEKKKKILESRVQGTELLSRSLAVLQRPPKIFLCASAVGFYGNRGGETLTEDSAKGNLFLSEVCEKWESATALAARKGIRVVNMRFGMILHPLGGALRKMLPPFDRGLGGIIGSGKQYISWVTLDDVLGAICHLVNTQSLHGPVNVVSPHPVTNCEFTKTLGRILRRPTIVPMPAFVAKLIFGQMAEELLLASAKVEPIILKKGGYKFRHPDLENALRFYFENR